MNYDLSHIISFYITFSLFIIKNSVVYTTITKKAILEVKLIKYQNLKGISDNGACCEAFRVSSIFGCVSVLDGCDTQFTVSLYQKLANGAKAGIKLYQSKVWKDSNEITFGNTIGNGFDNPMIVELNYWDVNYGYLVDIEVNDVDAGGNGDDRIARWSKTYKGFQRMISDRLTGTDGIRLDISVSGRCKPGYYGRDCRKYCLPQRRYTCNQTTGSKICKPGYQGEDCLGINECLSSPCQNGGECTDQLNSFSCHCKPGFTGVYCQTDIDYCTDSSCYHGNCVEQTDNYRCVCFNGFTGRQCETNINECASNPCHGKGTCIDRDNGFICSCLPGYAGQRCQTEINECLSSPCQNGGECTDQLNSFSCHCKPGFTGEYCQIDIDYCTDSSCYHGNCVEQTDNYWCVCFNGFTGRQCETNINECASNPCHGNATCHDRNNGFICSCPPGFRGALCQDNPDDCLGITCNNQGVCIDGLDNFTCQCNDVYAGPHCETLVDKCYGNRCSSHSVCQQNEDDERGYKCQCHQGYRGIYCEDGCTLQCVQGQGHCTAVNAEDLLCRCLPGYTGLNCESDINECESNPCDGDICIGEVNGFRCEKDNKCADAALSSGLVESFCRRILKREDCASITEQRGHNVTGAESVMSIMLDSFKCNESSFIAKHTKTSFDLLHSEWAVVMLCSWEFGANNVTCYKLNQTVALPGGRKFTYSISQPADGVGVVVPLVVVPSLMEVIEEYWYYVTVGGVLVVVSVFTTIMCTVTRRDRGQKDRQCRRSMKSQRRHPPLPRLPLLDKTYHQYEGMIYDNPVFNSICLASPTDYATDHDCQNEGARGETCNTYEEPARKYMSPLADGPNSFTKSAQSGSMKREEYYTEPNRRAMPHGECTDPLLTSGHPTTNGIYTTPYHSHKTTPAHPWMCALPLPPVPDKQEVTDEPQQPTNRRRVNPLYTLEQEDPSLPGNRLYEELDDVRGQLPSTPVTDQVVTGGCHITGKVCKTNPLYSLHDKQQSIRPMLSPEKPKIKINLLGGRNAKRKECHQFNSEIQPVRQTGMDKRSYSLKTSNQRGKRGVEYDEVIQVADKKANPLYYLTELKAKTSCMKYQS